MRRTIEPADRGGCAPQGVARAVPRLAGIRAALLLTALASAVACGRLIPAQHQTFDPASLRAGSFRLDPDHATLLVKIDHLGFSTYVGRFNSFDASLDFDPERPEASDLQVVIDTSSIDVNNEAFEEELRGPQWFDVASFPEASFVAREISVTDENAGEIRGDLTLVDVTRPVVLDVTFNGGANNLLTGRYTIGFAAETSFQRSAFGMDYLVPAIGDEVEVEIHAEFLAQN
ncbi:MAG: YceI family protein [Geminicoccaceae bacterium]